MSSIRSNKDIDDLNFIPLNIDSALTPDGSNFPLPFNFDEISLSGMYGGISLDFSNLNATPIPLELVGTTTSVIAPLTPYPKNIPTINDDNTPYNPKPKQAGNNTQNSNNNSTYLEYPAEANDDFLHSYNEQSPNERYLDNPVNAVDILRNFDLSLDYISSDSRKNCTEEDINNIFNILKNDHSGILATMKAYRVPYPIAKLLIKKIIKISLDNYNK